MLMEKLGLQQYIPVMCSLDYDMSKISGASFIRKYTIASDGPYCSCLYVYLE